MGPERSLIMRGRAIRGRQLVTLIDKPVLADLNDIEFGNDA
jgi:hypothetical protein